MHIFIDPLIGPFFTYSITYCLTAAGKCFSDSTRRAILLVLTVVDIHTTPQLNLYADPVCNKTEKVLASFLLLVFLLREILHDLSMNLNLHWKLLLPSITELLIQDQTLNMVLRLGLYLCSGGSGRSSSLIFTLFHFVLS